MLLQNGGSSLGHYCAGRIALSDRDRIHAGLAEFHEGIAKVVELSWQEERQVRRLRAEAGLPAPLYRRTRSNDVFDAVARHAIREFGKHPRVAVRPERQTVKFFFANKALGAGVLARFKQGDGNKLSSRPTTQAAMDFLDAAKLPYADLPADTTKIEVVWVPNELRTDYTGVYIVARDGKDILWDYPINRWSGAGEIVALPVSPPPDDSDDGLSGLVAPRSPAESLAADDDK